MITRFFSLIATLAIAFPIYNAQCIENPQYQVKSIISDELDNDEGFSIEKEARKKESRKKRDKKDKDNYNYIQGPTGATGAPGPGFPSANEGLIFHFIPNQDESRTGTWHAFVITPNQTRIAGPSVDISAASNSFNITLNPPILLGPYTIVIQNDDISEGAILLVEPISVTNSSSENITLYNSFIELQEGCNQQFHYNPPIEPLS